MIRRLIASIFVITLVLGLSTCDSSKHALSHHGGKPTKIIFLIGDGMGLTQISALFLEKDNTNNFKRFKHIGFMNTSSGSHKITDSAAGATAFACGKKTYNNAIGMDIDSTSSQNLIEIFSEKNYTTGLIATSSITHATPASFFAHTKHRRNEFDIASQLLTSDVDFFAGGGRNFFIDLGSDKRLYNWNIDTNSSQNWGSLVFESNKKYGYLLAGRGMATIKGGRGDFLIESTQAALRYIDKDKSFVIVEGSQIDWGGHAQDYNYVITEMRDFDKTVGAVLDYAEKDGNTLVVVTADHETGGLSLKPESYTDSEGNLRDDYDKVTPSFNTGGHTAMLIPVFAYGPGAQRFQGFYENTEIFDKFKALIK
ncbi:MAG: alkaline phosphatase [Bacteroidia bacterium]|jgi:alkaline phosphatase